MPRIPVTARNADLIFTSTPFEAKTLRWPPCGHNIRCRKIATHPVPKAVRWSTPRGRSFRIYRLAKKEGVQGGSERAFEQTITWPTGQGAWIGDEASSSRSKRTQEFEERLLFRGFQLSEFFGDFSGLAAVAQDGVEKRYRIAVVHETRVQADAPKRCGADFIGGVVVFGDGEISPGGLVHLLAVVLQHGRDDAVAGADIVEEEVAVGMKLLFRERGRDGEGAAVDFCAGRGGGEGLDVTNIAADLFE